jgi:hypothetical protein
VLDSRALLHDPSQLSFGVATAIGVGHPFACGPALIANPPVLLYPVLQANVDVPADVQILLVDPLRAEQATRTPIGLPDQAL